MQWLSHLNNAYYYTTSQLCVHGVVLVCLLLLHLLPTLTVKTVSLTISANASLTVSQLNKLISRTVHFTGRDTDFLPPWKNVV